MSDFDWGAYDRLIAENGLTLERPRHSVHPLYPEVVYPIDYGYINDTIGEDGVEIDIFMGTAPTGLVAVEFTTDHRQGDSEIKLLYNCSPEEVYLVHGFLNFVPDHMSGQLLMRRPMAELWKAVGLSAPDA